MITDVLCGWLCSEKLDALQEKASIRQSELELCKGDLEVCRSELEMCRLRVPVDQTTALELRIDVLERENASLKELAADQSGRLAAARETLQRILADIRQHKTFVPKGWPPEPDEANPVSAMK